MMQYIPATYKASWKLSCTTLTSAWEYEATRKMEDPLVFTFEGVGLLQEEIGEEEEELINWTTWATSNRWQKNQLGFEKSLTKRLCIYVYMYINIDDKI